MYCDDILYWLAAIRLSQMGPDKFRQLLKLFGDIKNIFTASNDELMQKNVPVEMIASLQRVNFKLAEKDLEWVKKNNVTLLAETHAAYPKLLKEISDAPLLLFAQGDVTLLSAPQLGMVGTRNPSVTGRETATQFADCLAQNNLVITSGLAIGIDAASHIGALKFGKTIAVLGSGLTHIYPTSNKKLAQQIIEQGLLVTEFPPHVQPNARNFPLRNRIISGLSLGIVVVEAALRSGSLITARLALEQNREVFAIPGSIHNPLARGCHHLIRQGAKLVETAQDILEELRLDVSQNNKQKTASLKKLDQNQRLILKNVGFEVTPMDTIIIRSGLTASQVSSILLSLELTGHITLRTGGYSRTR